MRAVDFPADVAELMAAVRLAGRELLGLRAVGSIALLGSWSTAIPGMLRLASWCLDDRTALLNGFSLMLSNRRGDPIHIEAVSPADSLAKPVEIFDNGVSACHDGFLAGSSSGVQMTGGVRPSARQTASIVPRIVAFARCLQFHVNRYATS